MRGGQNFNKNAAMRCGLKVAVVYSRVDNLTCRSDYTFFRFLIGLVCIQRVDHCCSLSLEISTIIIALLSVSNSRFFCLIRLSSV